MNRSKAIAKALVVCVVGCGGGGARSHTVPWDSGETRIIDPDGPVVYVDAPSEEECLDVETGTNQCIRPQEECGTNAADVVVDANGKLLEIVCYPDAATLSVEELDARQGQVAQNQNDAVIALDSVDDGADIQGDVSVDANNVVIYGQDPATSLIAGDVDVDGNNIIVRGVHIQGDASIVANNAVFLHCVIDGDVVIEGNNAILSACDVFGQVHVKGNNTHLTGNRVVGEVHDDGKNTKCEGNFKAEDKDKDGIISEAELKGALDC